MTKSLFAFVRRVLLPPRLVGRVLIFGPATLVLLFGPAIVAQQPPPSAGRWITAWGTSQQARGAAAMSNVTVRLIARVTIPGDAVRIRLDNTFGTTPLSIGKAYVGQRIQGAALAEGSNRQVLFSGSASVVIPAGGSVTGDAVSMTVMSQQDLAVSLHIPESDVLPSQHTVAHVTSYLTTAGAGDVAADETAKPFTATMTTLPWLKSIDVSSSSSTGSIVAFGDSITDGTCSTVDAHDRWEDVLSLRLALDASDRGNRAAHKAIVNEGIGGNTITRENLQPPPDSPPGLERLERDVLSHHGVTHMILFMGTNDIRRGASAAQVIAGMQDIARRAKAKGLKVLGATIIPRHNRAPVEGNSGWDEKKTAIRNEVNQWIRGKGAFDAVLDFDKAVQDRHNADLISPAFNCGDGVHPSPLGYFEMGRSLRLDLFQK